MLGLDRGFPESKKTTPISGGQAQPKERVHQITILLVRGDSSDLPPGLRDDLRSWGFCVTGGNSFDALRRADLENTDLILLNFGAFGSADPESVKMLRDRYRRPVICLVPYPTEIELDEAWEVRTDFLLFKPLSAREMTTRVLLLLKEQGVPGALFPVDRAALAPRLEMDERNQAVVCEGLEYRLTGREYALLSLLASDPGRAFSADDILESVWSGSSRATVADVHQAIYALRKKIEWDRRNPRFVITVPSIGYMLAEDLRIF